MLAVIADDITGATDTGAQFKKQGLRVMVLTDVLLLHKVTGLVDVIVLDVESRGDKPSLAYVKVREAVRVLKEAGLEVVYKKMDSTLRGNIGSELEAVMDETGARFTVLAPAFPRNNRTTVGGHQLVCGVPVDETEFGKDSATPVKESHIPTLLRNQMKRKVGYISLATVSEGVEALRKEFLKQMMNGNEVVVVDAITQVDMRTIAEALQAPSPIGLACGSAGFAEELSKFLSLKPDYPVLIIVGSVSLVSRKQVAKLRKVLNTQVFELDPHRVIAGGEVLEGELRRVVGEAVEVLDRRRDVVVTSASFKESADYLKEKTLEFGMKEVDVGKGVSKALGYIADAIVEKSKIAWVILTGGETAVEAYKAMKALGLMIEGEVLPGVTMSRLVGGKHEGLGVVTKAGGFGEDDTIVKAVEYLKRGV